MAEYWPSSFQPVSNYLDRTGLVNKDLLYGYRRHFSCAPQQVAPSGQDSLFARLANHSAGFGSFYPHGASHLIKIKKLVIDLSSDLKILRR